MLDEAICPCDHDRYPRGEGLIIDDDMWSLVQQMPSSVRFICTLDACHSGSGIDLKYSHEPTGQWERIVRGSEAAACSAYMLSGCADAQTR